MPAVRHVQAVGVTSLLDLTEQQWRHERRLPGRRVGPAPGLRPRRAGGAAPTGPAGRSSTPATCGGCTSCPASPSRQGPCPRARLRFDRITQPWLRELAKRWTRLRLASGLSIGAARAGVDALTCFSTFLALAGIDTLADVDRPLLERYLA